MKTTLPQITEDMPPAIHERVQAYGGLISMLKSREKGHCAELLDLHKEDGWMLIIYDLSIKGDHPIYDCIVSDRLAVQLLSAVYGDDLEGNDKP